MNPKYVDRSQVSQEYLDHEKEILMAQIMNDPRSPRSPRR